MCFDVMMCSILKCFRCWNAFVGCIMISENLPSQNFWLFSSFIKKAFEEKGLAFLFAIKKTFYMLLLRHKYVDAYVIFFFV